MPGYPATQTYWLEPTGEVYVGMRRYTPSDSESDCKHWALVYLEKIPAPYDDEGHAQRVPEYDADDSRWPTVCMDCGEEIPADAPRQTWSLHIYQTRDEKLFFIHSNPQVAAPDVEIAPPGAMWDASWLPYTRGPDGICLVVRCPDGHDWMVDGRASNCTMPDDNVHKCWVRHGDPRQAHVTVDKNGVTCRAGAGSIATGKYHGFLRAGVLTAG